MDIYRDVTSADSGLFETCARHTARYTARSLQTIYLCDACTRRLVAEAFNGRAPVYHGETLRGFCGLCNSDTNVTMRQWFACSICWNVVLAYQKSMAASVGIQDWWRSRVAPDFPHLLLKETEPVRLTPFSRAKGTKKQLATTLSLLDFSVIDAGRNPPTTLFNIEQKTGPGSIDEMSEFQLDVNDFNDIVGATNNTRLPTYIIHVQARHEYAFPTRRVEVTGMWWTDLITLAENLKRIAGRRGEDKQAAYYYPKAFRPIATFTDELKHRRYLELGASLASKPTLAIT